MTIYTECNIRPTASGFGLFERSEVQIGPEISFVNLSALEAAGDLTPLDEALSDSDFVGAGVSDIRGLVRNQPAHIYARIFRDSPEGPRVEYYGVESTEVPDDFFG